MMDALLAGLATVVERIAQVIPSVDIPWTEITTAVMEWREVLAIWMDTFPFLYTGVVVVGLMISVLVAKVGWYWINWLIRKIPGVS